MSKEYIEAGRLIDDPDRRFICFPKDMVRDVVKPLSQQQCVVAELTMDNVRSVAILALSMLPPDEWDDITLDAECMADETR